MTYRRSKNLDFTPLYFLITREAGRIVISVIKQTTNAKEQAMQLTSNQFYGGLNRRFEKRVALLVGFGFKYRIVVPGVAVLERRPFWKDQAIAAAEVMHACKRSWQDQLERLLRH
jgi:hypothetical protein